MTDPYPNREICIHCPLYLEVDSTDYKGQRNFQCTIAKGVGNFVHGWVVDGKTHYRELFTLPDNCFYKIEQDEMFLFGWPRDKG